jgi:hypothetical protein
MHSFATPPVKLKLVYQKGEGLLIANHLDQSETLSSTDLDHIYYTLFCSYISMMLRSLAAAGNVRN